ncbi:MAG: hypothetical protein WKF73_22075 [Nocardioidaceae bacterium]
MLDHGRAADRRALDPLDPTRARPGDVVGPGLAVAARVSLVRVQTAVVVVFASIIEYTFSPLLEVYTYRFDNVPMYVPPGHGLVYLAALAIGRLAWVQVHSRAVRRPGSWWSAVHGPSMGWRSLSDPMRWVRSGFCAWWASWCGGRPKGCMSARSSSSPTSSSWVRRSAPGPGNRVDPTGLVSIGNPPTGAAGGYGWFDLAALLVAPPLLSRWQRLRGD